MSLFANALWIYSFCNHVDCVLSTLTLLGDYPIILDFTNKRTRGGGTRQAPKELSIAILCQTPAMGLRCLWLVMTVVIVSGCSLQCSIFEHTNTHTQDTHRTQHRTQHRTHNTAQRGSECRPDGCTRDDRTGLCTQPTAAAAATTIERTMLECLNI